jgi:hypothetical protein
MRKKISRDYEVHANVRQVVEGLCPLIQALMTLPLSWITRCRVMVSAGRASWLSFKRSDATEVVDAAAAMGRVRSRYEAATAADGCVQT